MSDTANKSPLQFPLATIFIFCCIVAIPLALVTQVLHVDAGVRVTLAVTMLVASAYVVAIIIERAMCRFGQRPSKARRAPIRRPAFVLIGVVVFLAIADLLIRWI